MPMVNLTDFALDRRKVRAQLHSAEPERLRRNERPIMANEKIAKQKATFSLVAPGAKLVQLAGDFTQWEQAPVALKKLKGGLWKAVVSLPPGRHAYRFLVDGQWCDDPECKIRQPNDLGGENCVCVVSEG